MINSKVKFSSSTSKVSIWYKYVSPLELGPGKVYALNKGSEVIDGASLTELIDNVNVWESNNSPSLTVTSMFTSPKKLLDGINSKLLPSIDKVPDLEFVRDLLLSNSAVKVKSSPSISFANNSRLSISSSFIFWFSIVINSGASFPGKIFIEVCLVVVNNPSETVTNIMLDPDWFSFGIKVKVLSWLELPSTGSTEIDSNSEELLFK